MATSLHYSKIFINKSMKQGIVRANGCDECGVGGCFVDIENNNGRIERFYACWLDESTLSAYLFLIRNMHSLLNKPVRYDNAGDDLLFIDF